MKQLKNHVLLLTLSLLAISNIGFAFEKGCYERRAAFDIGSGKIKMEVADVDLKTNHIVRVVLTDMSKLPLREDLSNSLDERFSDSIQNKTVETLKELIKKASEVSPNKFHAIATESLRIAKNGNELVRKIKNETGLEVTIVSQEEEGILGFLTATSQADVPIEKAVVWDRGAGSFQITSKSANGYSIYMGNLGKVPMKNALLNIQGKKGTQSPNPVSSKDFEAALLFIRKNIRELPQEIIQKLQDPEVVVLGIGNNPLWGMQKELTYTQDQVLNAIYERLNQDDTALMAKDGVSEDIVSYVVSNLILAYGLMDVFGIDCVHYVGTAGANARGAILSPQFWK